MTDIIPTLTKQPLERMDFTMNWSDVLSADSDTIASSTWEVPLGITSVAQTNTTTGATIWLSGGTDGQSYTLVNQITTANSPSRIYRQALQVKIEINP